MCIGFCEHKFCFTLMGTHWVLGVPASAASAHQPLPGCGLPAGDRGASSPWPVPRMELVGNGVPRHEGEFRGLMEATAGVTGRGRRGHQALAPEPSPQVRRLLLCLHRPRPELQAEIDHQLKSDGEAGFSRGQGWGDLHWVPIFCTALPQ